MEEIYFKNKFLEILNNFNKINNLKEYNFNLERNKSSSNITWNIKRFLENIRQKTQFHFNKKKYDKKIIIRLTNAKNFIKDNIKIINSSEDRNSIINQIQSLINFYKYSNDQFFFKDLKSSNSFRDMVGKHGLNFITLLNNIITYATETQIIKLDGHDIYNGKENQDEIIQSLNTQGYYKLNSRLDNTYLDKLETIFTYDFDTFQKSRIFITEQELLQNNDILNLWTDKFFLNLAAKFLNNYPILDYLVAYKSFPPKDGIDERKEDIKFHFDADRIKMLKLIIYFSDVKNELDGPYTHISQSLDQMKPYNMPFDESFNYDDACKYFNKENIINLYGERGTMYLVNPSFIHRGTRLQRGERKILQLQWCNSLFGYFISKKKLNKNFVKNLINNYPENKYLLEKYL